MRKHVLVLTATAAILACGAIVAVAQAPSAEPTPGGPGGMMGMPGMMRDHPGIMGGHPGIMGMIGRDYGHHGSVMARIIFSLMDADGDGKLTLQEWQAAHERIFNKRQTKTQTCCQIHDLSEQLIQAVQEKGRKTASRTGRKDR